MRKRLKVYRVEHKDAAEGPFGNGGIVFYSGTAVEDDEHPYHGDDPYQEDIAFTEADVFGCCSLDEMRQWFKDKYVWDLADQDYVLRVFEVPVSDVKFGYTQCAFPRWLRAEMIEEHPVTVLLV